MTGEKKDELRSRIVDQVVGAFATFLLLGFVGWVVGLGDMRRDNAETAKTVVRLENAVEKVQAAVGELQKGGFAADAALDKRITVMEEQHRELLRHR